MVSKTRCIANLSTNWVNALPPLVSFPRHENTYSNGTFSRPRNFLKAFTPTLRAICELRGRRESTPLMIKENENCQHHLSGRYSNYFLSFFFLKIGSWVLFVGKCIILSTIRILYIFCIAGFAQKNLLRQNHVGSCRNLVFAHLPEIKW